VNSAYEGQVIRPSFALRMTVPSASPGKNFRKSREALESVQVIGSVVGS
jgi:hypothetical protein